MAPEPIAYSANRRTGTRSLIRADRQHAARFHCETSDLSALPPLKTLSRPAGCSVVPGSARIAAELSRITSTAPVFHRSRVLTLCFQRGMRLALIEPFTRDLPCIQRAPELIFRRERFPACITEEFKCRKFARRCFVVSPRSPWTNDLSKCYVQCVSHGNVP